MVHEQNGGFQGTSPRGTLFRRCERTTGPLPSFCPCQLAPAVAIARRSFAECVCQHSHKRTEQGRCNRIPVVSNRHNGTARRPDELPAKLRALPRFACVSSALWPVISTHCRTMARAGPAHDHTPLTFPKPGMRPGIGNIGNAAKMTYGALWSTMLKITPARLNPT